MRTPQQGIWLVHRARREELPRPYGSLIGLHRLTGLSCTIPGVTDGMDRCAALLQVRQSARPSHISSGAIEQPSLARQAQPLMKLLSTPSDQVSPGWCAMRAAFQITAADCQSKRDVDLLLATHGTG